MVAFDSDHRSWTNRCQHNRNPNNNKKRKKKKKRRRIAYLYNRFRCATQLISLTWVHTTRKQRLRRNGREDETGTKMRQSGDSKRPGRAVELER